MGELRVGEGYARDAVRVYLHGQAEQCVPDDETGLVVGEMGELAATGHIADRIDAAVRRLEPFVDDDAVVVARDAGALERKAVDVRLAAGRDEEMAALHRLTVIAKDDF